jgi:hypothetical protein
VAMEFFRPGADRVALADPSYKQIIEYNSWAFLEYHTDRSV